MYNTDYLQPKANIRPMQNIAKPISIKLNNQYKCQKIFTWLADLIIQKTKMYNKIMNRNNENTW